MSTVHPLRAYREKQIPKWSQAKLAKKINVARETLARWETGSPIDLPLVPKVSRATGIPPRELRADLAEMFATEHRQ